MLTSVKLVNGDREMILLPRQDDGIFLQAISAPMPEVREVTEPRTDDDGIRDTTSLFGARACSIELLVTESVRAVEDELTRYLHPRVRPYLVVTDDGWMQARRLCLRVSQFDAPLGLDLARIDARRITVGWQVPDGIWEAVDPITETVLGDLPADTGRTYPKTYEWAYPTTTAVGSTIVTSLGSVPAHFVAKLYGPCSGPVLINETTGERIAFTTQLVLAAGEYVEIDTRARTANLLGNTSATRLTSVDFTQTSWWRLEPGEQQIRYAPLAGSSGTAAIITYHPAWL